MHKRLSFTLLMYLSTCLSTQILGAGIGAGSGSDNPYYVEQLPLSNLHLMVYKRNQFVGQVISSDCEITLRIIGNEQVQTLKELIILANTQDITKVKIIGKMNEEQASQVRKLANEYGLKEVSAEKDLYRETKFYSEFIFELE